MTETRIFKASSNHFQTLVSVIDQARAPFQPKCLPNQKLADEIESCKRKIWECIGPAERQRQLEKKQKTQRQIVVENKENTAAKNDTSNSSSKVEIPIKSSQQQQQSAPNHQPKKSLASRSTLEFRVNALKVAELREELKDRGYETNGLKKDLRARLLDAMLVELEAEGSLQIPVASVPAKSPQPVQPTSLEENPKNPLEVESVAVVESSNSSGDNMNVEHKIVKSPGTKKMSIEPSRPESLKKTSVESLNLSTSKKMSIEQIQPEQEKTKHQTNRESFSSMQVEHHGTTTDESNLKIAEEKKEKSVEQTTLTKASVPQTPASPKNRPFPLSSAKKVSTETSPKVFKAIAGTTRDVASTKKAERLPSAVKIGKASVCSNASSDESSRPPSEASSSISKGSGKNVREMISKFSGHASLSSSVVSSGNISKSKEFMKLKDNRMARVEEMREKSKIAHASKIGMTPKEPKSAQSSLALKGSMASASAKKDKLAAQMREKAAAQAQTQKKPFFGSTSKLASASKFKGIVNFSGVVQDSLEATVKQQPKPVQQQKVQSPMDTYEISDREGSDSDDSDSEAENDKQKKRIPTWALRQNLVPALEEQYNGKVDGKRVDPDDIFPEVQSCDLVAIFGNKKADKYRSRNSSGNWIRDKVTAAEKLVYKRDMGFPTPHNREESEI